MTRPLPSTDKANGRSVLEKLRTAFWWLFKKVVDNAISLGVVAGISILGQHALFENNLIDYPLWATIEKRPYFFFSIAIVAGFAIFFAAFVFRKWYYIYISYKTAQWKAINFGIDSFWEGSDGREMEVAWNDCRNSIKQHPSDLRLLGASGWETFGRPDSPLHSTVSEYRGTILVLLMHPDSKHLGARAQELKMTKQSYIGEIGQTVGFLKELNQSGNRNIELKLYKQPAIWKMIIAGNFLWLQHYRQGTHVCDTPVYGFVSTHRNSLYHPFREIFHKRWSRDGDQTESVDLSQWTNIEDYLKSCAAP
jgi:hypothetical protein